MGSIDNRLSETLITLTSEIVAAHVSNNTVSIDEVANLFHNVYVAVTEHWGTNLGDDRPKPAVSISSSITPDHLVCLEDGKEVKLLKRYLMTNFKMTPDEYRMRWNLPADYPMVAPASSAKRSDLAKGRGLGQKKSSPAPKRV